MKSKEYEIIKKDSSATLRKKIPNMSKDKAIRRKWYILRATRK